MACESSDPLPLTGDSSSASVRSLSNTANVGACSRTAPSSPEKVSSVSKILSFSKSSATPFLNRTVLFFFKSPASSRPAMPGALPVRERR